MQSTIAMTNQSWMIFICVPSLVVASHRGSVLSLDLVTLVTGRSDMRLAVTPVWKPFIGRGTWTEADVQAGVKVGSIEDNPKWQLLKNHKGFYFKNLHNGDVFTYYGPAEKGLANALNSWGFYGYP